MDASGLKVTPDPELIPPANLSSGASSIFLSLQELLLEVPMLGTTFSWTGCSERCFPPLLLQELMRSLLIF